LNHLDIKPSEFLMIGNSLKSDILPLINIGSEAIHVPFHTTWQHEKVTKKEANGGEYKTVENLTEILNFFKPN
jgi:putative hydrolase of the HAD superfamily